MIDLRAVALGTLAALCAGIGIGWQFFGYPRGYEAGEAAAKLNYELLYKTSVRITGEREQCKSEVVKVNDEVDRQKEENRKILTDDRVATQEAITRAERAALDAAASSNKTQRQLTEAGNELRKIKDACVSAGVPAAYFDVLNRAIAGTAAGSDDR